MSQSIFLAKSGADASSRTSKRAPTVEQALPVVMSVMTETGVGNPKSFPHLKYASTEFICRAHTGHTWPPPPLFYILQGWPVCFCNFLGVHKQHFHMSFTKSLKLSTFPHCLHTCFCGVHTKGFWKSYWHLFSRQSQRN